MSHLPFTTTGALRHSGPKRVKRRWGGTVCDVLVLLALSALAGWLLHCVKHAAGMPAVRAILRQGYEGQTALPVRPGCLLAVAMGTPEMVLCLVVVGIALVLLCVVGWIKKRDDEAMARWAVAEPECEECGEVNTPFDAFGLEPWEDIPAAGDLPAGQCQVIDHYDVGRIVNALLINCCEVEDLLRKSGKPDARRPSGPVYCGSCGVLAALMPGPDARHSEAMKRVQGIKSGLSGLARMFPMPLAESRSEFGGLPRA